MSTAEALAKAAAKQLKTLNTVLDSEGREVIVEEREDTEAKTKFQETVDLLVAAGKECAWRRLDETIGTSDCRRRMTV